MCAHRNSVRQITLVVGLATEPKVESKDPDSDSEEATKGANSSPAVPSQPQRVALFPGMDPSALKVCCVCYSHAVIRFHFNFLLKTSADFRHS